MGRDWCRLWWRGRELKGEGLQVPSPSIYLSELRKRNLFLCSADEQTAFGTASSLLQTIQTQKSFFVSGETDCSGLCLQGDGFCSFAWEACLLKKCLVWGSSGEGGWVNLHWWRSKNQVTDGIRAEEEGRVGKPVLMQRIIHVNGRPVHVIVFCVLSMAGPFIALYYVLWRSPNILLLWSAGQPPRGGGLWPRENF